MKAEILSHLPPSFPWGESLYVFDTLASTNDHAKSLAEQGAPHGTCVLAKCQTGGRGRMGRSFHSPEGGVYLTVILRPQCRAEQLMHLTCAAGVAVAEAIQSITGLCADIKWINDLILSGRKVGGILCELALTASGSVDYALLGIGINCEDRLTSELSEIATCLNREFGKPVSPAALSAAVLSSLYEMSRKLLCEKDALMDAYRRRCVTCGKEILLLCAGEETRAKALDIGQNGELLVEFSDGKKRLISSGEASVRGIMGYLP